MLKTTLLHPEILRALAAAGHGSRVLIADGNYPGSTGGHPDTVRVYLNLAPGLVSAVDVLRVLLTAVPIEAAHVMPPRDAPEPAIFADYRRLLPELDLQTMDRMDFYDLVKQPATALLIATGEQRTYANLLLTIGVVPPA